MMGSAREAINDADIVVLLVDASDRAAVESMKLKGKKSESESPSSPVLQFSSKPVFLVLNKIDLVKKNEMLPIIQSMNDTYSFSEIIPVSALKGENLDDLKNTILKYLPEGSALYPEDYVSDRDERFFVSELVREEIFRLFKEEVPYSTTVEIEEFREGSGESENGATPGKTYIRAVIYVERNSQKGILIGKKGAALKQIGQNARRQIEEMIGQQVFLELFVKVREGWRNDKGALTELGYS